jgi:hypothetical protein
MAEFFSVFFTVLLVLFVLVGIRHEYVISKQNQLRREYYDFFWGMYGTPEYVHALEFLDLYDKYHISIHDLVFKKVMIWNKDDMRIGDYRKDFYEVVMKVGQESL